MTKSITVDALKMTFFEASKQLVYLTTSATGMALDDVCAAYFSATGIVLRQTVPSVEGLSLTAILAIPDRQGGEALLPATIVFTADPTGKLVKALSIVAGGTTTRALRTRAWELPEAMCASVNGGSLRWLLTATGEDAHVIAQLHATDARLGELQLESPGVELSGNPAYASGRLYRFTKQFSPCLVLDENLSELRQYVKSSSPFDTLPSLWPNVVPLCNQPLLEELAFEFCCIPNWQGSALAHVDATIQGVPPFSPAHELTIGPLLGTFSMVQEPISSQVDGLEPTLTLSAQVTLKLGNLPPLFAFASITAEKTDSGLSSGDPNYFSPDPGYFELLLEEADPDDMVDDRQLPSVGDLFQALNLPWSSYFDVSLGSIMVAGVLDTSGMDYSIQLRYEQPVRIGKRIEVEGGLLMIDRSTGGCAAAFEAALRIEDADSAVDVVLAGAHDQHGWSFAASASLDPHHSLKLASLFSWLLSTFDLNPSSLPGFTNDIGVDQFSFDVTADGIQAWIDFVIDAPTPAAQPITFALSLIVSKAGDATGHRTIFGGTVQFGTTATFNVLACVGDIISLEIDASNGPVTIGDLCTAMGLPMSADVGPAILVAAVRYDTHSGAVGFLFAISEGSAVGVFAPKTATADALHLVKLSINADLMFSNTGLALPGIPPTVDFGLAACVLTLANDTIGASELARLTAYLPENAAWPDSATLPIPSGTTLWTPFTVGSTVVAKNFVVGGSPSRVANISAASPAIYYVNVEQTLGPVALHRLGLGYGDGTLLLGIDGGFSISALSIDFIGLTFGATFKGGLLAPSLKGLAVSFQGDALSLTGELILCDDGQTRSYDGSLAVQTADLSISALGSWIEGDKDDKGDRNPSLFVYGELTSEAQGPEPFLVRGLCAGFGINRDFALPTVNAVTDFPFVEAAMADANHPSPFSQGLDPAQVLAQVKHYVPPCYGAVWGAAGVRFTSFGVIDGFALATLLFGASNRLSLLGVAQAALPKNAVDPIVYIEIDVEAQWSFGSGRILALGTISPNSFVLDPSAELRGGFAFSAWFTDDPNTGARAGDFVYSIGGYHPSFKPPAYYPTVPRISLNWQRGALSVVGSGYFTLCGAGIMAGGMLSVTWESGPVRAWFDAHVDFLMGWHPFVYAADIGISLGASFTIDLLVTSVTVSVHVGVDLSFMGPPFRGEAEVDLDVISFRIPFGDNGDSGEHRFLSWPEFVKGFFPVADVATANLVRINVTRGLHQSPSDGSNVAVIDGSAFQLRTLTSIPATAAEVAIGPFLPMPIAANWNTQVGVRPAGVAAGGFTAVHRVSVSRTDGQLRPASVRLKFVPILNGVIATAWGAVPANKVSLDDLKTPVIADAFTGLSIEPDHTTTPLPQALPVHLLMYQNEGQPLHWHWLAPVLPEAGVHPANARTAVMTTVMASDQAKRRKEILAAARWAGFRVSDGVSLTAMAKDFIPEAPTLKRLGEEATA